MRLSQSGIRGLPLIAPQPSCVLHVPMWGLSSGGPVQEMGRGGALTLTGTSWNAKGRTFDGSDDKIDAGNPAVLQITGALTLIGWAKTSAAGSGGEQAIVSKWTSTGNLLAYELVFDNGKPKIGVSELGTGATVYSERGTVAKNNNIWHQIVGVWSPSATALVYADGVLQSTTAGGSSPASIFNSSASVAIGYMVEGGADNFFTGTIGEVMVFNRVLTAFEVYHNYLASKWRYV